MLKKLLYIKQLKYGINTLLLGLVPVFLAILLFQILFDINIYQNQIKLITVNNSYNIKMLVYYVIAGFSHIIVCSVVVYHFFLTNNKNVSATVLKLLRYTRFFCLMSMTLLIYFLDSWHINIAYLSHERLYEIMSKSDFFRNSFKFFPHDFLSFFSSYKWFHIFSMFPFILICFAIAVMIFGSFHIAKEMYIYTDQKVIKDNQIKEYISDLNSSLRNYVQLLSIVLVSSTITTVLFFQVPTPLIKDETIRTDYGGVSTAMGICWGVIFSLTLLFLCIYPYKLTHKKISSIIQDTRIKDDPKLERWLDKYKSYYSLMGNMKLIVSIISPAIASIVTTAISHAL